MKKLKRDDRASQVSPAFPNKTYRGVTGLSLLIRVAAQCLRKVLAGWPLGNEDKPLDVAHYAELVRSLVRDQKQWRLLVWSMYNIYADAEYTGEDIGGAEYNADLYFKLVNHHVVSENACSELHCRDLLVVFLGRSLPHAEPIATLQVDMAAVDGKAHEFAIQRRELPPLDDNASRQMYQVLQLDGGSCNDVAYPATSAPQETFDFVWQWFGALAVAGFKVDAYFSGTSIGTNAQYIGEIQSNVFGAKAKQHPEVTLAYRPARNGYVGIDGCPQERSAALRQLRGSHVPTDLQ